ncbi:MAG: carbonic anhydrase [Acidimicrobiia bacterium]|nr:carbonic anhydrase [Acidimicrobiia bacterium]
MTFQPNIDEILSRNAEFAEGFPDADLPAAPQRNLAVVACMDARMDVLRILGLANGEAHVIRNAGGIVTDDVIRSLCLSQRSLGTREVILVHHTGCGVQGVNEEQFRARLEREVGVKPSWSVESFADPHEDVAQSIRRLRLSPFISHKDHIRGFVYNIGTGRLEEVEAD